MSRLLLLPAALLALAFPLAVAASSSADRGVTRSSVLFGGTVPLTGEASTGGLTAKGAAAYFSYVDAHGGVAKRKIHYKYLDDAYDPAQTIQDTRQLVQQDHVFAIFNPLGTAQNITTRPFLNAMRVPQLFVSSGWGGWAREAKRYPWTIGFIPTYTGEGIVYGRYIKKHLRKAKVAVLYQDDEYGRELLAGLKRGLGKKKGRIVAQQGYDPAAAEVKSQVAALKASGANTLMIFAFGKFAVQAFVLVKTLGWKPHVYVNAVAAATSVMQLASSSGQTQGAISIGFYKDPADPRWNKDRGMKLYKKIVSKYVGGGKPGPASRCKRTIPPAWCSGYYLAGMAPAYALVQALKKAGRKLTRASMMKAVLHLKIKKDPFVLPGIRIKTSPKDRWPIEQAQLQRWKGSRWKPIGKLVKTPRR